MKNLIKTFQRKSFSRRYAPHQLDAPLLALENVSVRHGTRTVLENISFDLSPGDGIAVVGPNGAGKTTLFQVVAGIKDPFEGVVRVSGHEPGGHTCIAYVPQRSQVDWSFPATVADVVMMGRINKMGPFLWPQADDWEIVRRSLKFVDLIDYSQRQISELSGGEQQRVAIARALINEPEVILADEPTGNLDPVVTKEIMGLLKKINERGTAILMATHNYQLIEQYPGRIIKMDEGRISNE